MGCCSFQVKKHSHSIKSQSKENCCRLANIKQLKKNWTPAQWRQLSFALIILSLIISLMTTALFLAVRSTHSSYVLEVCTAPHPDKFTILGDYTDRPKVIFLSIEQNTIYYIKNLFLQDNWSSNWQNFHSTI